MGTVETELDIDLSAFWMPFSANRQFKRSPRLLVGAKDMHYTAQDGHKVLDGTAGLWSRAREDHQCGEGPA
jgi:adenosylmethionine-8-amino-7-oxononanoate aminotransferase